MDKKIRKKNLWGFSSLLKQFITTRRKTMERKIETPFIEANQPRLLRNVNFIARQLSENTWMAAAV